MKKIFITTPIIIQFDYNKEMVLEIDSSS
jgi:hypothetical protein